MNPVYDYLCIESESKPLSVLSGFNKELHTKSTLEFVGTQRVDAMVQSTNATTHSYTIQPLISADGKLCDKIANCSAGK